VSLRRSRSERVQEARPHATKLDVSISGTGCASIIISEIRRRWFEVNSMLHGARS
jgi:hypothetical protein